MIWMLCHYSFVGAAPSWQMDALVQQHGAGKAER
jgi:hypothetical protein